MRAPDTKPKTKNRTVLLFADVSEASAKSVIQRLIELVQDDAEAPITFIIDSFGGEVYDAFAIYDFIKSLTTPVHTLGLGKIMSAGALLLTAGTRGHRKMGASATLMYHQGHDEFSGDVKQIRRWLAEFDRQELLYDQLVAKETGRTLAEVQALYADRLDHYMAAQQAVEFGFADALV